MKFIILNADDYGSCIAANKAIELLFKRHKISSASLMANTPYTEDAVKRSLGKDYEIGLHLTLNDETQKGQYRALSKNVPSLYNKEGCLYPSVSEFYRHVNQIEVEREMHGQYQNLMDRGINLSHLDCHMSFLIGTGEKSFLDLGFDLAHKTKLPLRIPKQFKLDPAAGVKEQALLNRSLQIIKDLDLLTPDYVMGLRQDFSINEGYEGLKAYYMNVLKTCERGVTEIFFHPCLEGYDAEDFFQDYPVRYWETQLLLDPDFTDVIFRENIQVIQHRHLKSRRA